MSATNDMITRTETTLRRLKMALKSAQLEGNHEKEVGLHQAMKIVFDELNPYHRMEAVMLFK